MGCSSLGVSTAESVRTASNAATTFVDDEFSELTPEGTRGLADEHDRYVFAVFYRELERITIPTPYKVIAVNKRQGSAEELELTPESPYWIRGRK